MCTIFQHHTLHPHGSSHAVLPSPCPMGSSILQSNSQILWLFAIPHLWLLSQDVGRHHCPTLLTAAFRDSPKPYSPHGSTWVFTESLGSIPGSTWSIVLMHSLSSGDHAKNDQCGDSGSTHWGGWHTPCSLRNTDQKRVFLHGHLPNFPRCLPTQMPFIN